MPSVFDQPTSRPSARAMCAIIREVVVLPLVPVTATTGTRGVIVVRRGAGLGRGHPRGRLAHHRVHLPAGHGVEHLRDRRTHHLRTGAVPPREGHHDLVLVAGGPHAYGEPGRARLVRDRPDQPAHRAQREPLPEPGVGLPGPGVPEPDPLREPLRGLLGDRRQPADVEGQLDRGAREVEVRALEDPQLDQGRGFVSHAGDATELAVRHPSRGSRRRRARSRRWSPGRGPTAARRSPWRSARGRRCPSRAAPGRSTCPRGR